LGYDIKDLIKGKKVHKFIIGRISFPYIQVLERSKSMKKLVCRKCGGSFFRFRKKDSSIECFKCKIPINISNFKGNNIDHLWISWKSYKE
jgi:protein-arginine kinase activator protein McsA